MARKTKEPGLTGRLIALVPEGARQNLRTGLVRLAVALATVTILCCVAVIIKKHVAASDQFQVDATTLVPRKLPSWASSAVRRELACLPGLPDRFSIMEAGICRKVAEAFERNPWVDEVISVEKAFPNRMAVSLRLRRPVAGVRYGDLYYLVDEYGRRLTDGVPRWPKGEGALPVIIAVKRGLPDRGGIWQDENIRGAAMIARMLVLSRDRLQTQVAYIDLTNFSRCPDWRMGDVHLIADTGAYVKWGRSPLRSLPGELTLEEKVAKMLQFEEKRGPLSSYRYVDIRFDNVQHGPRLDTSRAMDDTN